ncbi:MAG: hypothetical protein WCR24_07440 [Candidatus Methanomethylophilaceae archaeon]
MTEIESMMHRIPDDNTIEIAEYGPRYMDVKSSLYISDLMIDFLNGEAKREYDQLDLDTAEFILVHRPYWLTQEIPHAETIGQMTTVRRLKIILQDLSAIDEIELTKAETKQFGMMCSTEDYGKRLIERGLDTELFRAMSIENADSPLDFESIRRIRDHDSDKRTAEEEFEYRQYLAYLREMEERENERMRQAQERGVELIDVPEPEISEEILEGQYGDMSEDPSDDLGDICPDDDVLIEDQDDDVDVFESDTGFLDNLIICTMDVIPEATCADSTAHDGEETEPLLENTGSEEDDGFGGISNDGEIAEFLEEYCDRPRPALGRLFGRLRHGH